VRLDDFCDASLWSLVTIIGIASFCIERVSAHLANHYDGLITASWLRLIITDCQPLYK
jgi:hypothetical protein